MDRMVRKMAEAEGITEDLKATDQMAWVGRMNSIRQQAEETICNELIYARSLPPFSLCFLLFCQQQGQEWREHTAESSVHLRHASRGRGKCTEFALRPSGFTSGFFYKIAEKKRRIY